MKKLIEDAIQSVNSVADVNTVIGEPVTLANGVTIVPFSKVSVGFATGGSDRAPKTTEQPLFAGGGGAGITVSPVAFLAISNGHVQVLQIEPYFSPVDRALEKVPQVIDQLASLLKKKSGDEGPEESVPEEKPAE